MCRSLKVYTVTITMITGPIAASPRKRQSHQSVKLYWSSALFPS